MGQIPFIKSKQYSMSQTPSIFLSKKRDEMSLSYREEEEEEEKEEENKQKNDEHFRRKRKNFQENSNLGFDATALTFQGFSKTKLNLKNVVRKQKIKSMLVNFKEKLKRNHLSKDPVEFNPQQLSMSLEEEKESYLSGFFISKNVQIVISFFEVMQFFFSLILYGLCLIFEQEIEETNQFIVFQYISLLILGGLMFMNCTVQKMVKDKKLHTIRKIFQHYKKNTFAIDLICILVLLIDLASPWTEMKIFRLCFLLKFKKIMRKISDLEFFFIVNFERQQYWGVIKVFIVNFLIAHIIAVVLLSIISGEENWTTTMKIDTKPWNQKYAFAYFWAMSTMLGFGNAVPSNHREAILISVIECFSCVILAYIINHVGTLLTNISKKNEDKQKNLQTSRRLAEENNISDELLSKINNYIRQNDEIEKKFNFKGDNSFLMNLPENLKTSFFKESNKKIFTNLIFFQNLTEKTTVKLAESITIAIAHPQEVVFSKDDPFKFTILKKGQIGFYPLNSDSRLKNVLFDKVKIKKNDHPFLINLDCFNPNYSNNKYMAKALDFSILYQMDYEKARNIFRNSNYDYQLFCQLCDESKHIIDEFQTLTCQYCTTKHNKLKCPKLHYIPIKSLVVDKYLADVKMSRNFRQCFHRRKNNYLSRSLLLFSSVFKRIHSLIVPESLYTSNNQVQSQSTDQQFEKNLFAKPEKMNLIGMSLTSKLETNSLGRIEEGEKNLLREVLEEYFTNEKQADSPKFWEIQLDTMENYMFYFSRSNASNLINKPLKAKEKKKLNLKKTMKRLNQVVESDIRKMQLDIQLTQSLMI